MDAQMMLEAEALRKKNEKELKNEIKILCSLVSPWVMCQYCLFLGPSQHCEDP